MGRLVKRLLISAVILVLALAAAAVAIVATVDLGAYRQEIAAQIRAATGREVTFAGDMELRIFTLSPAVVVDDVAFANAPWGSRPQMIGAERIEVRIALMPLLTGDIVVRQFVLVGADILLETDSSGRPNWLFSAGGAEGETDSGADRIPFVSSVRIEASRIVYRDGFTGLETVVSLDRIRAETADPSSNIRLAIDGSYNGTPITGEGELGPVEAAMSGASDYPVDLRITYGDSDLDLALRADLSGRVPRLTGEVTSRLLDLDGLGRAGSGSAANSGELFTDEELPIGAVRAVEADVTVSADRVIVARQQIEDVHATLSNTDGNLVATVTEASVAGGNLTGELNLDLRQYQPRIAVRFQGNGLDLGQVTRSLADQAVLESEMSFNIDLRGAGRSAQAIANGLEGLAAADAGAGRISGAFFDILSADVLRAVLPWTGGNRQPRLNCGVARFDFAGGVGRSRILMADSTRASVFGGGTVNLGNERVDLRIQPATKGVSVGAIASLVPLRITGPILDPEIGPDPAGVPENVGDAVTALPEAARNIVGSLIGREQSSEADVCADARAAAAGDAPASRSDSGTNGRGSGNDGSDGILRRLNPFNRR